MTDPNTPNPQSPQNPWGKQPPQPNAGWGQPPAQPPQPQWGQQPQANDQAQPWAPQIQEQQWGQPSQPEAPRKTREWPTWFFGILAVLALLTSFLPVGKYIISLARYGHIGGRLNWWGNFSADTGGIGVWAEEAISKASIGGWVYVMVFLTVAVLVLYGLAAYFDSADKVRESAIMGVSASGVQLLSLLIIAFDAIGDSSIRLAAGWYFWLIIAAVGMWVSIELLTKGRDRVTARLKDMKASADARSQAGNTAAPAQPQQQQWGQQPQQPAQPQQGWSPQPQQPTQPAQQPGSQPGNEGEN